MSHTKATVSCEAQVIARNRRRQGVVTQMSHTPSAGYVKREGWKRAILKRADQNYARHMIHYMDGMKIAYGISVCPETGKQFLVEIGKDNNICELTPSIVRTIRKAKWRKESAR